MNRCLLWINCHTKAKEKLHELSSAKSALALIAPRGSDEAVLDKRSWKGVPHLIGDLLAQHKLNKLFHWYLWESVWTSGLPLYKSNSNLLEEILENLNASLYVRLIFNE